MRCRPVCRQFSAHVARWRCWIGCCAASWIWSTRCASSCALPPVKGLHVAWWRTHALPARAAPAAHPAACRGVGSAGTAAHTWPTHLPAVTAALPQVLIFSTSVRVLDVIEDHLEDCGVALVCMLHMTPSSAVSSPCSAGVRAIEAPPALGAGFAAASPGRPGEPGMRRPGWTGQRPQLTGPTSSGVSPRRLCL